MSFENSSLFVIVRKTIYWWTGFVLFKNYPQMYDKGTWNVVTGSQFPKADIQIYDGVCEYCGFTVIFKNQCQRNLSLSGWN